MIFLTFIQSFNIFYFTKICGNVLFCTLLVLHYDTAVGISKPIFSSKTLSFLFTDFKRLTLRCEIHPGLEKLLKKTCFMHALDASLKLELGFEDFCIFEHSPC